MQIIPLLSDDAMLNFSYLIIDDAMEGDNGKQVAYCVDPWDGETIQGALTERGATLVGIINTHLHFDHTRGNEALSRVTGAPILTKEALLEKGRIDLGDGAAMIFVDANGHTMDHLVILLKENDEVVGLISGDLLFNCGVGNCKHGGNVDLLYESVRKIDAMVPDTAILYPGHDYMETNLGFSMANGVHKAGEVLDAMEGQAYRPTTMGLERELNLFLRAESLEDFRRLRHLRDQW